MAAFSALTAAQQKIITDYMNVVRGYSGELARLLNKLNAGNEYYNTVVQPVLALITGADQTTPINDNTQLAGAQPLTQAEVVNLQFYISTELTIYDTNHQNAWSKACGPTNITG
jgi:hypothetical protein